MQIRVCTLNRQYRQQQEHHDGYRVARTGFFRSRGTGSSWSVRSCVGRNVANATEIGAFGLRRARHHIDLFGAVAHLRNREAGDERRKILGNILRRQPQSTRAFLIFLEEKAWIASAAAVEREAIRNGRQFSVLRFPSP